MLGFRAETTVRTNKLIISVAKFFRLYSARQWVFTFFSILSAQTAAWILYEKFFETYVPTAYHNGVEVLALTISLTLILFPSLYYFSYRPLLETIGNLQVARNQLVDLNQELVETNLRENYGRQLTETLLLANQAFSQSLSLDSIVDAFLDFLFDFVPYDVAAILLPINQSRWVVFKSVRQESGVKTQIEDSKVYDLDQLPALKMVMDAGRALIVSDIELIGERQPGLKQEQMNSWLGIPFKSDHSILAVCELYKGKPDFFTAEYLKLTEMLVHVATTAIQNAMLFDEVRTSRESLQLLSHRLVEVQEKERRHIARELHDEAGQGLASLMVGFRLLEAKAANSEAIPAAIDALKQILSDVSDKLHGLAVRLRPASLDHLGVVPILTNYVDDFGKKYDVLARFETIDINGRLPLEMETAIYRMVQEGLTNIARHAQATRVDVLLQNCGNKYVITIEDNGVGFIPEAVNKSEHLGLVGIAERAEMLNGNLTIESIPGVGTSLIIEVPSETSNSAS
ncbi:MAG: GAF domain-containing sensor histidine kinase [Anaerolineales bacterium]|nr:GAF domain-containing sensor histidine kinase [Anaerolineales bacterium]